MTLAHLTVEFKKDDHAEIKLKSNPDLVWAGFIDNCLSVSIVLVDRRGAVLESIYVCWEPVILSESRINILRSLTIAGWQGSENFCHLLFLASDKFSCSAYKHLHI